MDIGFEWITQYGYLAIFLLLMVGIVGLPVPDETLLVFVGYLSSKGALTLGLTWAAAFSGSICGMTLSYGLGRVIGPRLVTRLGPYVHVQPEHLAAAEQWLNRWGKYALVLCYFVPGVRHFAAIVAGTSQLSLESSAALPTWEVSCGRAPSLRWVISSVKSGRGYRRSCITPG